jgi:predicted AlkP superfamily pyrophosphatase or phosphodiesterase
MTTVFILLDAFRWDYINKENTPFLYQLTSKGVYVRQLKPGLGFCERTEILTGMRANKSLNFTALGYCPDTSFYKKHRKLLNVLSIFDKNFIKKRYRWFLNRVFKFMGAKSLAYGIPLEILQYFDLTEDKVDHRETGAFLSESILDIMKINNKSVFYDSFTALGMPNGTDDDRIQLIIDNAKSNDAFYLLYIGESDARGHFHGPESEEMEKTAARIDSKIKSFVSLFRRDNPDSALIICGDHGMMNVDAYFNIGDEILKTANLHGLQEEKDYLFFLDSTLARFWFFTDRARIIFEKILSGALFSQFGRIMNSKMADEYHVPYGNKKYGDIVWLVNPGVLIYPDFFHSSKHVKGMHGYDPSYSDDLKGFCLVTGKDVQPKMINTGELIDLCPTICDVLNIPCPSGNQGISFL